jgi:hypothetical protein
MYHSAPVGSWLLNTYECDSCNSVWFLQMPLRYLLSTRTSLSISLVCANINKGFTSHLHTKWLAQPQKNHFVGLDSALWNRQAEFLIIGRLELRLQWPSIDSNGSILYKTISYWLFRRFRSPVESLLKWPSPYAWKTQRINRFWRHFILENVTEIIELFHF